MVYEAPFSVKLFIHFHSLSYSTDIGTINILWSFGNFGYILGVSGNQALATIIMHIYNIAWKFVSIIFNKTTGCLLAGTVYKSWLPTQVRLRHDFGRMFLET